MEAPYQVDYLVYDEFEDRLDRKTRFVWASSYADALSQADELNNDNLSVIRVFAVQYDSESESWVVA